MSTKIAQTFDTYQPVIDQLKEVPFFSDRKVRLLLEKRKSNGLVDIAIDINGRLYCEEDVIIDWVKRGCRPAKA